jgi:hypothetical protein
MLTMVAFLNQFEVQNFSSSAPFEMLVALFSIPLFEFPWPTMVYIRWGDVKTLRDGIQDGAGDRLALEAYGDFNEVKLLSTFSTSQKSFGRYRFPSGPCAGPLCATGQHRPLHVVIR